MVRKSFLLLTFLWLAFISPKSFGQSLQLGGDLEKVKLYLGWSHQYQFAGYYMAIQKGFYQEAGLEVELDDRFDFDNFSAVANGEAMYGCGAGSLLLTHPAFDQLTALAVIFQQSPIALLTLRSSGINSLADLEGKTIAVGAELTTMIANTGIDLDKINVTGIFTDFNNLLDGSHDAISYYITDHGSKIPGNDTLNYKIFRPIEYGIQFYGETLFTSRMEVENNPDRVEAFRSASLKGWQYALDNPEETLDVIYEKYYSGLTREQLRDEMEITVQSLILPQFYDFGDMQRTKWVRMSELLYQNNLLASPLDIDSFLYNPPGIGEERIRKITFISAIVLGLVLIGLLISLLYNRQLQKAVQARTYSLEKTNRELDSFVYSVSHDIRSPLSSIQGILNLMRLDPENNEKYVALIKSSIDRLENFTGDILDYSRNSRSDLKFKQIDLEELINKSITNLMFLDEEGKISFTTDVALTSPFYSDEWRIEVILGNIISNAIKYRNPDIENPEVRITARNTSSELSLTIEDNGIGIDKDHLHNIFDMFYRATEHSTGSGLGLYIVRETVNQLEGEVSLTSSPGTGTKVVITLPLRLH